MQDGCLKRQHGLGTMCSVVTVKKYTEWWSQMSKGMDLGQIVLGEELGLRTIRLLMSMNNYEERWFP